MEVAIKLRTSLRSSFTKNFNSLQRHLADECIEEAKATFNVLENKWIKLQKKDEEIMHLMAADKDCRLVMKI